MIGGTSAAWLDITRACKRLPLAWFLAVNDIQSRYRRTLLGPFWLVVAQAIWVGALGYLQSRLFNIDTREFTIYLAAGLPVWVFIVNTLTEAPATFERGKGLIFAYPIPISLFALSRAIENLILLAHQMIVYVGVCVWLGFAPDQSIVLFTPGLIITTVASVAINFLLGVWGARYRDIRPAISSVTVLLFVVTPVFWTADTLGDTHPVVLYNPFYHFLEILRAPLLGEPASMTSYMVTTAIAFGLLAAGVLTFVMNRRNLPHWL